MITLTEEQQDILAKASALKQGEIIVVNALAGCAKTSTLKLVAEQNHEQRFLYLAFNRKIVDEASSKFPDNTKASTLHAIARAYTGRKTLRYLNMDSIAEILGLNIANKKQFFEVFNVLKAYQSFCQSAFSLHELDALKDEARQKLEDDFSRKLDDKNKDFVINQRLAGIDQVEQVHKAILNADFTTFDTFLKEFVETADQRVFKYDYIVLDESQDVSRLLAKFIVSLIQAQQYKIIIVGDDSQKIYGFLGNTNLSKVILRLYKEQVIPTKSLTKSFRFQHDSRMEILSNQILQLRSEKITGARETVPPVSEQNDRIAYLSRGTFSLLAMAIYLIKKQQPYHLYGGINNFDIQELKDIYNLYLHTKQVKEMLHHSGFDSFSVERKVEVLAKFKDEVPFPAIITKSLKAFSSFFELYVFSSSKGIFEMENSISIVHFIHSKKQALESIATNSKLHLVDQFFSLIDTHSNEASNTILSTVHKAKGLEFEEVTILKSLSIIFDPVNDEIITTSYNDDGAILGLEKTNLAYSVNRISNIELASILNEEDKKGGNIFNQQGKVKTEEVAQETDRKVEPAQEKHAKDKATKRHKPVIHELVINEKMADMKEEYNILYVAITRAIRTIKISNANYIETLDFLYFINNNRAALMDIFQGRDSNFLVTIKRKGQDLNANNTGIIYEDSFISKKTLVSFLGKL